MKMELRDLEYFAVIAETGNIGRAAEKLELSQPALSLSLRRLERVANSKIVARTPKGIELTPAGATLLRQIGKLRLMHDDVVREIDDVGRGNAGHLRVGVTVGSHEHMVASAAAKLMNASPKVTLTATLDRASILLRALRRGDLDFLITTALSEAGSGIAQEQVHMDHYVVYGGANHRLARRRKVSVKELANERWAFSEELTGMPRFLLHWLADVGQPAANVAVYSNSIALRLTMIAESQLLGFASEQLIRRARRQYALSVIRVEGLDITRRSVVMYREGGYLPPVARRLVELLKEESPEVD